MIALDTNIFIYAISTDDNEGRRESACGLLEHIAHLRAIVPLQVVGEFLNVCKKRKRASYTGAIERADHILRLYTCVSSSPADYLRAAITAHRYRIQYFDALIISVARRAGAILLLSEDMQDGQVIEGLTVINPFDPANENRLSDYLVGPQ